MFKNQFFHVLPTKLSNPFKYEKIITNESGILMTIPQNCIVITGLLSIPRLKKQVVHAESCKFVSYKWLDKFESNKNEKMDKYIVSQKKIEFKDDKLVYCNFPLPTGEKKELIDIFDIMQKERELNGEQFNALAYKNAMSGIKGSEKSLNEMIETNFENTAYIGPKISAVIKEFKSTGVVKEAERIKNSERHIIINQLTNIWGVGDKTALQWYNKGYRCIEDVMDANEKLNKNIQIGIKYKQDLNKPIPRAEVEEIVTKLNEICQWKANNISIDIVGGYRRNKVESGDIDIVLSHDNEDIAECIVENSLQQLQQSNILADVYSKGLKMKYRFETSAKNSDSDHLDKALTIIKYNGIHRQVDIIACTKEQYPFCLLGWSGSATFERLIKMHAKNKGYTLSSSALYDSKTKEKIPCSSEAHIFQFLGLPYRPAYLRNA